MCFVYYKVLTLFPWTWGRVLGSSTHDQANSPISSRPAPRPVMRLDQIWCTWKNSPHGTLATLHIKKEENREREREREVEQVVPNLGVITRGSWKSVLSQEDGTCVGGDGDSPPPAEAATARCHPSCDKMPSAPWLPCLVFAGWIALQVLPYLWPPLKVPHTTR